jgi:hypothetical protein
LKRLFYKPCRNRLSAHINRGRFGFAFFNEINPVS